MSSTVSTTSQHGATNPGATSVRKAEFGPLPLDYKFRGDAEDSELWKYMEETVLNQALAKEGFKMTWLYEKQKPDQKMYENEKGVMSPTNKIKYQAKIEEIEAKELKVFGILLDHIEPASRAFALIGIDTLMKGDPVLVFDILKKSFNNTKTVAGLFGAIEKFNESAPPNEELVGFLNRNYNELTNYGEYGEKKDDKGVVLHPNGIPEAVKVLTIFVKARKNKTFALQLGDFITEHIFTLSFDDPAFTFKAIYDKLLVFLRHREISAQGSAAHSPAVFTAKVFSAMVRKELGKELGKRNTPNNLPRSGKFGNPKRPKSDSGMWDCSKCGRQKDHSTRFCPVIHPSVADKIKNKSKFSGGRYQGKGRKGNPPTPPLHEEDPKDKVRPTTPEVHNTSVEPRFTFGVHYLNILVNLTANDVISDKKIFDSGSQANIVNQYYHDLIRDFRPCKGNVIGAGGKVLDAIVGRGYIDVLGVLMPVYYGPNLPKSVFSIGIFTRDFGFEVWFKDHMCVVWIPRKLEGEDFNDFEVLPLSEDYLYEIPESWFN
jgi:hypothetical protein